MSNDAFWAELQRIFEIGSHFVSGRSAHTITLTALITPPGGNVERNCR